MPAFTYLSDSRVAAARAVADDKECDNILQELRRVTGEDWIVEVVCYLRRTSWSDRLLRRQEAPEARYTLYADCHGQWQIINCAVPEGGSVFHASKGTREAVMNYMLGFIAGFSALPRERRES